MSLTHVMSSRGPTVLLALFLGGCGGGHRVDPDEVVPAGSVLIDEARIARSGGHTAWDVLRFTVPMLQMTENRNSQPRTLTRRGRGSIILNEALIVVLDGVRQSDFRILQEIPANTIHTILVLDGIEATYRYGTDAGSGAVVIRTKQGPS
jgi:outer membrane cobalamin receptor